ncbi:MAG: DUF4358 domain-containing protein [Oscillospiraceae bacterium]
MKGNILAISALCGAMILTGCSNSGNSGVSTGASSEQVISPAEKTAKLLTEVEFPEMVEVTEEKFSFYYKAESTAVKSYSAYVCGSGAYPDEFGVFETESEQAATDFSQKLEDRIEKQRETYTDYTPAEMYKFDDCFVKQDGNYVYYAICADNVSAKDILG